MADISMCKDNTCPSRKTCFRFIAKPSEYQSYMKFDRKEKAKCNSYWAIEVLKLPKDETTEAKNQRTFD